LVVDVVWGGAACIRVPYVDLRVLFCLPLSFSTPPRLLVPSTMSFVDPLIFGRVCVRRLGVLPVGSVWGGILCSPPRTRRGVVFLLVFVVLGTWDDALVVTSSNGTAVRVVWIVGLVVAGCG
jgi:hypothetical protein